MTQHTGDDWRTCRACRIDIIEAADEAAGNLTLADIWRAAEQRHAAAVRQASDPTC